MISIQTENQGIGPRWMGVLALILGVALALIVAGMLDPFMVLRIGMVLTVTLCWVADKPYRAFAWAMSFLALASFLAAIPFIRQHNFQLVAVCVVLWFFGYCLRAIAV